MADDVQTKIAEEEQEKPYDASDPQQVSTARKKAGSKKARRMYVLKELMQHEEIQIWLGELLTRCHVYGNNFVQGDPYASFFRMGEENIGKMLLADIIEAAPKEYLAMLELMRQK